MIGELLLSRWEIYKVTSVLVVIQSTMCLSDVSCCVDWHSVEFYDNNKFLPQYERALKAKNVVSSQPGGPVLCKLLAVGLEGESHIRMPFTLRSGLS